MRAGDFAEAWAITDRDVAFLRNAGIEKHAGPRHFQRIWRGEVLEGRRVLVRCYHGLGDTIQFARFLPPLARRVRELTVWCQPQLLSLIETVKGVDRVLPLHDGTPEVDFDVDIEIMEIPHAIRANRPLIENKWPYLTLASRDDVSLPNTRALAVGLVWEGSDWDKRRSVPARLLKSLAADGVQLLSLQRGEAAKAASEIGAINISTLDIVALGQIIRQLDLLLSVDTMVAHLAGALGQETWIMLHVDCDWRWPRSGRRSLWYPTARLFHQRRHGDWAGVIEEVRAALGRRVRSEGCCEQRGTPKTRYRR